MRINGVEFSFLKVLERFLSNRQDGHIPRSVLRGKFFVHQPYGIFNDDACERAAKSAVGTHDHQQDFIFFARLAEYGLYLIGRGTDILKHSRKFTGIRSHGLHSFRDLRNLEAATIFMALVICCVETTVAIRFFTSFKLAMLNQYFEESSIASFFTISTSESSNFPSLILSNTWRCMVLKRVINSFSNTPTFSAGNLSI